MPHDSDRLDACVKGLDLHDLDIGALIDPLLRELVRGLNEAVIQGDLP